MARNVTRPLQPRRCSLVHRTYSGAFIVPANSRRGALALCLGHHKEGCTISRFASQLNTAFVGNRNASSEAGFATYGWDDLNGDHFAQSNEVRLDQYVTSGNGFNANNPTSVDSANVIDPDLEAPITTSVVAGFDREPMPDFALQVHYSFTRMTRFVGTTTPRVGVTLADYGPGPTLTGTLPNGEPYSIATFIPDAVKVRPAVAASC